jgi:hypothetical protein
VLAAFLLCYERSSLQHDQPGEMCNRTSMQDFRLSVELALELLFAANTRPFHRSVISALRRVTRAEHQGRCHLDAGQQVHHIRCQGVLQSTMCNTTIMHVCAEVLRQSLQERMLQEAARFLAEDAEVQGAAGKSQQHTSCPPDVTNVATGADVGVSGNPASCQGPPSMPGRQGAPAAPAPAPAGVDKLPRAVLGQTILSLSAMPDFMQWVRPVAVEVLAVVSLSILDVLAAGDAGTHLPPALVRLAG